MGHWHVVVPEATVNLVTNPSFERATTGYSAGGGTLVRSTEQQRRGLYSGKYTPAASVNDGIYYGLTLSAGTQYTFSLDVRSADTVPMQIYAYDVTAGAVLGTAVTWTGAGAWARKTVTFTTGANTSVRLYVTKNNSASAAPFYTDGWQCEAKGYATTYVDGDRDGCLWAGGAHTSASSRSSQHPGGGRVVDLADYGFRVEEAQGVGMPPITNITSLPALSNGSIFQRTLASSRVFTLVATVAGSGWSNLHSQRQTLIDWFKPDRLASQLPVQLRYTGAGSPLAIDCYYDAGLEMGRLTGYAERVAARFIAMDPYFTACIGTGGADSGDNSDSQGGGALAITVQQNVANANYILQRTPAGAWQALGTGLNDAGVALAIGNGKLYVGGRFTTAGGVSANRVAQYDLVTGAWSAMGNGFDNQVNGLAVGPNGHVYAVGNFIKNAAGTVTFNHVAEWDPAAGAWSTMASGISGTLAGECVTVGSDGKVYVGINGTTTTSWVKQWNGSAWSNTGALDAISIVGSLAFGPDGGLYAGADKDSGGVFVYNGSSWAQLGSALGDVAEGLAFGPDGRLYAVGPFATSLGGAFNRVAVHNGSAWQDLNSGLNGDAECVAVDQNGLVYMGGGFTETEDGLVLPDSLVIWRGSSWSIAEVNLPGTAVVSDLLVTGDGTLYIVFNTAGTAIAGGIN
jgi:hypothetical protein